MSEESGKLQKMDNLDIDSNTTDLNVLSLIDADNVKSASDFVGNTTVKMEDALKELAEKKVVKASKIAGDYKTYIEILLQKILKIHNKELSGDIIILDSYDGAEHRKAQKQKSIIILFSSQLISEDLINSGLSAGSSHNILTWLQMLGSETA